MSEWDLGLRIYSWQQQRAVRSADKLHLQLNSNLWVCCPLAMAGEDPSLHAMLLGSKDKQGQLFCAPDPRSQKHRLELFSRIHKELKGYFEQCLEEEDGFPQLLLPSQSAANVLVGLADYLAHLPDSDQSKGPIPKLTEEARELGRLLQFYAQRLDIPGQQSVLVASQILDEHWAFGQDLQGHLGAQMLWINPPEKGDLMALATQAQAQPMGAKTDARMDNSRLGPALDAWAKVAKNSSSSLASFRRQAIEDLLQEVLQPIWAAVLQAHNAASQLESMDDANQLAHRERRAFEYHMSYLASEGKFSRSDTPLRAIYSLAEMEDAQEQLQAALIWGDRMHREKAVLEGSILRGETHHVQADQGEYLAIESHQLWLKIRRGDELVLMNGEERIGALVEDMVRRAGKTRVLLAAGRKQFWPKEKSESEWALGAPDWQRIHSERGKIARNLEELPPTHQPEEAVDGGNAKSPGTSENSGQNQDPLEQIEALR